MKKISAANSHMSNCANSIGVGCAGALVIGLLVVIPVEATAEILWSGDYDTGDYTQWHMKSDSNHPQFAGIPAYGRPVAPSPNRTSAPDSYYGDGSLMGLVTSPVRNGTHANRVVVKNSRNGVEPADCDNGACDRRHTNLNNHLVLGNDGVTMPYQQERWFSVSHFVPSDWDVSDVGGSWGITVFELKSPRTNDISGVFEIQIEKDYWRIQHRWAPTTDVSFANMKWQWQMFYAGDSEGAGPYPSANAWPDGVADFPDMAASHAALQSLNRGGWTDWVINVRWDGRGKGEGGNGFMRIWKREDSGPWVEVLHIKPKLVERGGEVFDHGIGFKIPGSGYGPLAGMYTDKERAWRSSRNRVIYNDNIKIGSDSATFAEMSPDGSTPVFDPNAAVPNPPKFTSN